MELPNRPFQPPASKFLAANASGASSTEQYGRDHTGAPTGPVYYTHEKFTWKKLFKKKYIPYWIGLIIILILVALITIYHKQIVDWLKPVSNKIRSKKWGFIIPVLVLIAISFPPLFGHEIVAILCGVVYGLWIGFAIVAAGTFIGEIATYFAFKYVFRRKAEKLERTNLNYATLATITREGGFLVVFITRLSAIPSHFTTAVFATCGVNFWLFFIATFASLPKQLVTVYLGIILENPSGSRVASDLVLVITFLITLAAAGYIYWQMRKVRPRLLALSERHEFETDQAFSHEYNPGYGQVENPANVNMPIGAPLQAHGQTHNGGKAYEPMRDGNRGEYAGEGYGHMNEEDGHYGLPVQTGYATHPQNVGLGVGTDARYYAGGQSAASSRLELGSEQPVRPNELV